MFGLTEKTDGIPVLQDEAVIEASEAVKSLQLKVGKDVEDETRWLRTLNPLPNDRAVTEEEIAEATSRLDIAKGTQSGWFSPELRNSRVALQQALQDLQARRDEAIVRLDAIRREARKPLVREFVSVLEALLEAREAVLSFDAQWDADRDTVQPGVERTTLEPLVTADSVDRMKQMLKAQGWL